MANYFRDMQTRLERIGFEYVATNSKGGETWEHPAHTLVIYPGMKEHTHRNILRDVLKAVGIKQETNKRNVDQIKDRQAKQREIDKREVEKRNALVEQFIADLETAKAIRGLTAEESQRLREYLREQEELRRLMSDTPGWA